MDSLFELEFSGQIDASMGKYVEKPSFSHQQRVNLSQRCRFGRFCPGSSQTRSRPNEPAYCYVEPAK